MLPGLEGALNDVTQIRITKADGTRTTLDRKATDWIVGERGYPADSGKLRKLLLDLGSLKAVERKTRIARNYPVLGVEDVTSPKATGARIDIVSPGKTWSLIVGSSMDANNVYVRVVDSAQSLLASPLVLVDADPKLWLDPAILDIAQNRVSDIDEQPAKGPGLQRLARQEDSGRLHRPRHPARPRADRRRRRRHDGRAPSRASRSPTCARPRRLPPGTGLSHAVFKTFDGLEIDVSGYSQANDHYIDVSARATDKSADAEAQRINSRVHGWDYEIPDYRYEEIFPSMDSLLKPLPQKKSPARAHKPK